MPSWTEILHSRILHGAITGMLAAAMTDLMAFRRWQFWHDAVTYNWQTATWRWFNGAVIGAASAMGFSGFLE